MTTHHLVRAGDCLSRIARRRGFRDLDSIWQDDANKQLRQDRTNPNVLAVGDNVTIPLLTPKEERVQTGRRNRITVTRGALETTLEAVFQDDAGDPLDEVRYSLTVDGGPAEEGKTDANGAISQAIPPDASRVDVTLFVVDEADVDGFLFRFELGMLQHESVDAACRDRLVNLGYPCGDGGTGDEQTPASIRAFQDDQGLTVNGTLDDDTRTRLREIHEGE